MNKNYQKPSMTVVKIGTQQILCNSRVGSVYSPTGIRYGGGTKTKISRSRGWYDYDDEWQE